MSVAPSPTLSSSSRLRRRHALAAIGLLLSALLVYVLGNGRFPLIDRDEPRYAQSSRQMLQGGDWTTPHFLDELRLKKPVGIYWLQASTMRVIGDTPFAARLPSALATVATLAVMLLALPPVVGHRRAWWAAFAFGTALLPAYLAKVGMTDAVLNLWITLAMLCLYRVWRGEAGWPTLIVMGVAVGCAVLTKGPPVLLFLGMTVVALAILNRTIDRAGAELRVIEVERAMPIVTIKAVAVVAIALAICVPWVVALQRAHPEALERMFVREVVDRGASGQEGHAGPPGYYLASGLMTFFPWSLLLPAALWQGWRRRAVPWVRFSLAAVLGPWVFLEVYRTKLPHYGLPAYPFLALLTADVLLRGARGVIKDLRDGPFLLATRVVATVITAAGVVAIVLPWFGDEAPWPALVAGVVLWVGLGIACFAVARRFAEWRTLEAARLMGLASVGVVLFVACVYVPLTSSMTLSRRVGERLAEFQRVRPGDARMIGYKEPAVAFYQGGTIVEESDDDYVQDVPSERWPRWLVADAAKWDVQPEAKTRLWREAARLRGLNVAAGFKPQTVLVLENRTLPATMPAQ